MLFFAENVMFYINRIRCNKANSLFIKEHSDVTMPPDFYLYETYTLSYKDYYYDGKETAKDIIAHIEQRYDVFRHGLQFLDWGCGPARVIRHFPQLLPRANLYATDYNLKYVDWCRNNIKGISFSANGVYPPTTYQSSFFDIVIGLSLFTHLSEENHHAWLNELHRILKPDGIAFLTTQGKAYRNKLSSREQFHFDSGKLVVRKYTIEGNRLFSSFQPPDFMKSLFNKKLEIVEFIPGVFNNKNVSQDIWLLKKVAI